LRGKLLLMVAVLLLGSAINVSYANTEYTFLSGNFNSTSYTAKALNTTLDAGFTVKIYNHLEYNKTTGGDAYIGLSEDATGGTNEIQIVMSNDSRLLLYVYIDSTSELLYNQTATFKNGKAVVVSIDGGGLNVGTESDNDFYISDFNYGTLELSHLLAKGSDTNTVESGYVTLTTTTYSAIGGIDISSWMPTIVSLAMLGMVIGMLEKFTH